MIGLQAVLLVMALGCVSSTTQLGGLEATFSRIDDVKQRETFRALVHKWIAGDKAVRRQLDGPLRGFMAQPLTEPIGRTARVLVALNAVAQKRTTEARQLASEVHGGAPGVTRDLSQLVLGLVAEGEGKPPDALAYLEPLLHKLIDEFATDLLNRALIRSAIDAKRWGDAIRYVEVAVREARSLVRRRDMQRQMKILLRRIPRDALMSALVSRVGDRYEETSALDDDALDIARSLAQQLAVIAADQSDQALARELLSRYGSLLGPYGETVARLAVQRSRGRVLPRTIGLLASLRDPAMRRRSADVLSGMLFALRDTPYRLVSRVDSGVEERVTPALNELAAAGAAVIVAAVDPRFSQVVASFAESSALPVILLTPDALRSDRRSPFVFMLGADPTQTTQVMAEHLRQRGSRVVASLGAPLEFGVDDSRGVGLTRLCDPLPSQGELRAERVDALLLLDGSTCTKQSFLLAQQIGARVGVGLGAAEFATSGRRLASRLSAGIFPTERADARLKVWNESGRDAPSWFVALGRDAALLAWTAVSTLKVTSSANPQAVQAQRVAAASALAAARVVLWTTDEKGFSGGRTMKRDVVVLEPREGQR